MMQGKSIGASTPKVLLIHLARRGVKYYATQIINHLYGLDIQIYLSTYHELSLNKAYKTIPTFRHTKQAVFTTFFVLPYFLLLLLKEIKWHNRKIIYLPGFHHWNLAIIKMAQLLGAKTILTVHDPFLHSGETNWLIQKLQNACLKHTDTTIYLSKHAARQGKQIVETDKDYIILPHGIIAYSNFNTDRIFKPNPRLLFFGRISQYKGLDLLLEAIQKISKEKYDCLTIAGELFYTLPEINNSKVHVRTGRQSDADVVHLFNTHDILILPYQEASQSGIITIGIAANIPMVCTRVGGLVEQLSPDEALWVEPTVDSIQAGIEQLISDPNLYRSIHEKLGIKRQNSHWEDNAKKLLQLVKRLSI